MATVTLNSADSAPNIVLSGGNLTATGTGGSASYRSIRSTEARNKGKLYFEGVANASDSNGVAFGLCNSSALLTHYVGYDTNGVSGWVNGSSGSIYYNGGTPGNTGNPGLSVAVGVAVDFSLKKIWFLNPTTGNWNNASSASQNPATGLGGVSIAVPLSVGPLFASFSLFTSTSTDVGTFNFGATTFANTIPSGFSSWNTDPGPTSVRVSTLGVTALVSGTATARVSTLGVTALVDLPVGPWPAVAAAGGPALVQKTMAHGSTSPITATLPAAPTVGNLLLFIQSGYGQALTPPTGLTVLFDGHADRSNDGSQAWTRVVQAGDGTTYAFTGASDNHGVYVFEFSNAGAATTEAHGTCSASGLNIAVPLAAAIASTSLRVLIVEDDFANSPSSAGDGSNTYFVELQNAIGTAFHHSAVAALSGALTGTFLVPWSAGPVIPTYALINVAAGGGGGGGGGGGESSQINLMS